MSDRRFPSSVFGQGTEPDARFTLANERTFLAWIGTSLALISVGVALESLALDLQPGFRLAASLVLMVAGLASPVQAWFGWMGVERSLRLGRPLPPSLVAPPLAVAVAVAGVLVVLAVVLR